MLVQDIGEFDLIKTLAETISSHGDDLVDRLSERGFRVRVPLGDDAAAWDSPAGLNVLTTDTMVEGVHFSPEPIGWSDLGWKSLAVNLSDIAAMGCAPLYAVVTLGLRGDLPVDGLVEMYQGMLEACRQCGGAIVGGDVVRSPTFFVTVAMEGAAVAPEGTGRSVVLRRDAASAGDQIAVTGSVGCSAGGLRILAQGTDRSVSDAVDPDTASHLTDAHNRPIPRVTQGMLLAREGVTAAIDISDGLVDDLGKMCAASGVGAVVYSDLIPADGWLKRAFPDDWLALALGGGEDYELLFTARPALVQQVAAESDVPVTVVGEVVDGAPEIRVVEGSGKALEVHRGGWEHFQGER